MKDLPFSQRLMMRAAQPTPGDTDNASTGQLLAQAPHSMQPLRSTIRAFRFSIASTPWGHTWLHTPHPMHRSESIPMVTTPSI
jgi:hypothetical protein